MPVKVGKNCFIAETAVLIGDVMIGDDVAIFDNTVLRGDLNQIIVGHNSNLQDNVTVHTDVNNPAVIGKNVSVGHNAIVHGAFIEDDIIIGMGAIVMNGARIHSGSVVAAGTVVTQETSVPENSLIAGTPGKIKRTGDSSLRDYAILNAESYAVLREKHKHGDFHRITGSDLK